MMDSFASLHGRNCPVSDDDDDDDDDDEEAFTVTLEEKQLLGAI